MLHNPRNAGITFGIVDIGRFAEHTVTCWKWRFKAWLAFFTFNRFNQRRFFTADIGAVAMYRVQIEAEIGTE